MYDNYKCSIVMRPLDPYPFFIASAHN